MGDIADSLIDGEFDYITGEYIGEPCGYPRTNEDISEPIVKKKSKKSPKRVWRTSDTPAEANVRKVRKELALLIIQYKQEGRSTPVNSARRDINIKYGKSWRQRGFVSNSDDQWQPLENYPLKKEEIQ